MRLLPSCFLHESVFPKALTPEYPLKTVPNFFAKFAEILANQSALTPVPNEKNLLSEEF